MGGIDWTPGELLELSGSYWKTCTLHAGVRLDIFTLLDGAQRTGAEVARALSGSERGVTMLLNALTAMGLLVRGPGGYATAPAARDLLSRNSDRFLGYMILHHANLVASWSRLEESVLSGGPVRESSSRSEDEELEHFLMGMFNLAMGLAPRIVTEVDLAGRRRLLDLGGGPGTYAIQFCLHNPGLKAAVFDLPTTRPFAEKIIARFKLQERVEFLAGDFLADPVPGRFDVAWLSQILHGEGPEECRRVIRKAVGALEPGGLILIHEFILDDTMDSPLHPALFSLNMLLGTEKGQAYSEGQLRQMLESEGARNVRRFAFRGPNDSGILAGVV
jgi:hypothetical protein